jgi:hypothetical protein
MDKTVSESYVLNSHIVGNFNTVGAKSGTKSRARLICVEDASICLEKCGLSFWHVKSESSSDVD